MRAFHGQQAIKDFSLARADALIHGSDHAAYEHALGIPCVLGRLAESICEGLTAPRDATWPGDFLRAIPVGADLRLVWPQFALALLSEEAYGMLQYVQETTHTQQRGAIEAVRDMYRRRIQGIREHPTYYAAAAYYAAEAAAAAGAYAAAYAAYAAAEAAYDAEAAYVAAEAAAAAYAATYATAAEAAAAEAAAEAVYAAADAGRRHEVWCWQADTLLALLRAAPCS